MKNGNCSLCSKGFYGINCEKDCKNCPSGECDINGKCIGEGDTCKDKTLTGDMCNEKCDETYSHCKECFMNGTCTLCEKSFYNSTTYCEDSCANCPEGECDINGKCLDPDTNCINSTHKGPKCDTPCDQDKDNCLTCERDGKCLSCKEKKSYGDDCTDSCENCPEGICEFDGTCTKEGDCKDFKFYEDKCQTPCNNISNFCDTCYRKGTCKNCTDVSHYGDNCTDICNTCPSSSCNMEGVCTDENSNCVNDSYYGDSCEHVCTDLGKFCGKCNRSKICFECTDKTYYGPKCEDQCITCPDGLCSNDGTCEDNQTNCLNDETFGPKCTQNCTEIFSNCEKCNRNKTCSLCYDNKYYGDKCDIFCEHCPKNECKVDGNCVDTEEDCPNNHFYGDNCNISCTKVNDTCDTCTRDGTCLTCNSTEFWGTKCENYCDNCPGNQCYNNGTCIDQDENCIDSSFTGKMCNEPCTSINDNCLYCTRKSICFECKNKTMFGADCSKPCGSCPDPGTCENNGICNNTEDNCKDAIYTGANCSVLCSEKYDNCDKCDRDNICFECKNKEFYGNNCTLSCENCPGECNVNGTCFDNETRCDNESFTGENCSVLCRDIHDNCQRCERNYTCLECIDKTYYGDICTDSCENCPSDCDINGICIDNLTRCDNDSFTGENCSVLCKDIYNNCGKCERNYTCTDCIDKTYFGMMCNDSCDNCPGDPGFCDIYGICYDNSTICDNDTYSGANCSLLCQDVYPNCKKCNRDLICFECINETQFGPQCDESCSNCPKNITDLCYNNGTCRDGITPCYNDSFTGDGCDILCNIEYENCDKCYRNNSCTLCRNETFYGEYCNISCANCPDFCYIDGICKNDTAQCSNPEYTGPKCDELCIDNVENCLECDRYNICTLCENRTFFGEKCNISCGYCPGDGLCSVNGTCENTSLYCSNDSYTEDDCSVLCSDIHPNCKRCDRNHKCIECFDEKFYGDACNDSCANCPDVCDINGTCKNDTKQCSNPEYTGPKCDELCIDNVENCLECDRYNICTLCENRTFFGEKCNISCGYCPGDGLCSVNGTCENTSLYCSNDSYTGDNCSVLCSDIYENSKRCDRNHKSIECFNKTFYGYSCEYSCANCPGICDVDGICTNKTALCRNDSYTGPWCNETCMDRVYNNCKTCDRDYICSECINKTFYGNSCNISRDNCPESEENPGKPGYCEIDGKCFDNTSLCFDNKFYGDGCNETCKNIGTHCLECKREGICSKCDSTRFFGEKCEEGCVGCTEEGCNILGYCHEFKCKGPSYGLGCNNNCSCQQNSDSLDCGKFGGQCLECKFGYYGKNCSDKCNYKCQTELCCFIKNLPDDFKAKLEIKTKYKYIDIKIGGNFYTFEIDYNYGYPLTLINTKTLISPECKTENFRRVDYNKGEERDIYSQNFTNYFINGSLYHNETLALKDIENDKEMLVKEVDLIIADLIECKPDQYPESPISGIIGLGFFNSISNSYFEKYNENKSDSSETTKELNILSYFLEGDEIKLIFGNMFEEQIEYVERLTSCDVILDTKSDIQGKKMTCKLDQIKSAKYTEGFELNDAYITFSLGENSSLILGNNTKYGEYLYKVYFQSSAKNATEERNGSIIEYYLYPSDKMNKLPNFGFVFNSYFYSYSPTKFFKNSSEDGQDRFLIEINKNSSRTEFILGKEFLENIKFTINNEEAKIYFYARNAEFSDKSTTEISESMFDIKLDARELSAITLSIIIVLNIAAFTIYYCVKRRIKTDISGYTRLL